MERHRCPVCKFEVPVTWACRRVDCGNGTVARPRPAGSEPLEVIGITTSCDGGVW